MSNRVKFILILGLAAVCAVLAYPREDKILKTLGIKNTSIGLRQGLDLKGGAYLVYQADLSKAAKGDREAAMNSLIQVIQKRVNPSGVSEILVQTSSNDRVIVQLPGVKDVNQAINLIGKTAQLEFFEVKTDATGQQQLVPTDVSGNDVSRADEDIDVQSGKPIVRLTLKSGEATKKFANLTSRINQSGTYLLTTLDQQPVFGPATVQGAITDGVAQLSGNFTIDNAKQTAQLLNAGALPVPIQLVEQRTVGATLGQESVERSIVAGVIGLGVVAIFMILYYRWAGLMAVFALLVYTLLTISLYKLSVFTPSPIVLTLAGIAGFILSIGMAVDANILIFERMREELRGGKNIVTALENGFDRAWTSIRDSNISTLITCAILYTFSSNTPIIKGFAVTLGLGVLVSMFTAVVVSRTFMRMFVRSRLGKRLGSYGVKQSEVQS